MSTSLHSILLGWHFQWFPVGHETTGVFLELILTAENIEGMTLAKAQLQNLRFASF